MQYYKKNTNLLNVYAFIALLFWCHNAFSLDATFNINQISQCPPSRVLLSNQSVMGPGIKFIWDFDKGALVTSNETDLEQIYTDPGDYDITLYAIEGNDTVTDA